MVKSNHKNNNNKNNKAVLYDNGKIARQYNRLASMGKISSNLLNQLYNPIDAINRFLNLALQHIDEDSQSRQFILESKSGIRKMLALLKRLDDYAKKMKKEFNEISKNHR